MQSEMLIKKIESLPPKLISEIEDFVDFVFQKKLEKTTLRDPRRLLCMLPNTREATPILTLNSNGRALNL